MTEVQQSRACQVCKSDKADAYCHVCKKETPSGLKVFVHEEIKLREALKGKMREGERGKAAPHCEFSEKDVQSGDPRLPAGVRISMAADRKNDAYHQVVKDAKTGEVLHEEYEPLSQHRSKKKPI